MKNQDDVRGLKGVRAMLGKKGIDISMADIRVQRGRCDIRGIIKAQRGFEFENLETELMQAAKVLRQKPEIKEVVIEVSYR